jgi:hypothetical protein
MNARNARRARVTRALWVVGGLMWMIVVVGWPLLALAQLVLTPDVKGSALGDPPTLSDVGFLVFIISVPVAVGVTGLALIPRMTPSSGSPLRTAGLVALVLAISLVAYMAAQLVGFFFLTELIGSIFRLN